MKKLLLALLLFASPAFADNSFPPARYDIGGDTIEEAVANFRAIYGSAASIQAVPFGSAQATCDPISRRVWGVNWPSDATATNGKILYGCSVQGASFPEIVYSYTNDPEFALRIFRHEAGHILGWPGHHPD